jgi:hypothetical protein
MAEVHPPSSSAVVEVDDGSVDRLLAAGWTRKAASSTPSQPSGDQPPKTGRGSSRDAWVAYADSQGVAVDDDMSRDDIIAAVEGD